MAFRRLRLDRTLGIVRSSAVDPETSCWRVGSSLQPLSVISICAHELVIRESPAKPVTQLLTLWPSRRMLLRQ